MPKHARLARKFAIVRGLFTQGNHDPTELLTGIPAAASGQIGTVRRPALGCVVSKLREGPGPIPPYVSTSSHKLLQSYDDPEEPAYLGPAHKPFSVANGTVADLAPVPAPLLADRRKLLEAFDKLPRRLERSGAFGGADSFQTRAMEMLSSSKVRDALDL